MGKEMWVSTLASQIDTPVFNALKNFMERMKPVSSASNEAVNIRQLRSFQLYDN